MISKQLQRHNINDRREQAVDRRHADDRNVGLGHELELRVCEDEELAPARTNLLQVRLQLFQQLIVRRNRDHRHVLVNERKRTVLQLASRVALRVNVGDLLKLERAFQGNGVERSPAEEQRVVHIKEAFGEFSERGVQSQSFFEHIIKVVQRGDDFRFARGVETMASAEHERKQQQIDQLRGKRLGRRNPNLRACLQHDAQIRLPRQGAGGDIAQSQGREVTGFPSDAKRSERIGRFTRLRNGDEQRIRLHSDMAVAELACDLDLAGNARQLLDPVPRYAG